MADLHEHVAYLSQEIGPRPAGTEEEQRAALYISEQISNGTGLPTSMEDFQCNPDSSLPRALLFGVAAAVTLVATIVSLLSIPALVISLLCAALIAAEIFGKPVFSRLMNRGVSQNVVARYQPPRSTTRAARRRKIIVVANYDSGKIRRGLSNSVIGILPIIYWAEFGGLVLMPVLMLCRMLSNAQGTLLLTLNILLGVCMVLAVLPVLSLILEKTSEYNEAANCNASGVAVMMEVAARVAEAALVDDEEEALIHGEAAALSAGLVPEGAELVYNVAPSGDADVNPSMESAEARLAAAKAAVAALSGKPVSSTTNIVASSEPTVAVDEVTETDTTITGDAESNDVDYVTPDAPVAAAAAVVPEPEPVHEVPEWFKRGQEQAKRPATEAPVRRSRFADALKAAEEEAAAGPAPDPANAAELEDRVNAMRESVYQAAEAAGAHKTEAIAPVEVQPEADAPEETPEETPAAKTEEPAASAEEAPEKPTEPEPAPAAPAAAPAVPPVIIPSEVSLPTDDPDVMVREGSRPLTGSMPAVADDSPLANIPSPAAAPSATGAAARVVIPAVGEVPAPAGVPVTAPGATGAVPAAAAGAPAAPSPAASAAIPAVRPARKRRAITLPDIGVSQELPRISMDGAEQAAPLSEERPAHDGRVRNLGAVIPSVSAQQPTVAEQAESALLGAMPSLSQAGQVSDPGLSGSINLAGAFSSMGATGAAQPLTDDMFEEVPEDELYIQDADDSIYQEQVTETGAIAGPGYVEMPKSRFGRLFGKLRRKDRAQVSTPQEWLDVEDDFEATQVGTARGGWESFREEDYEDLGNTSAFATGFDDAFEEEYGDAPVRHGRPFEGGAYTPEDENDLLIDADVTGAQEPVGTNAFGLPADFVFEGQDSTGVIEQFRQKRVDVEVWFVALGAELAGNGGMKAFMEAHAAELKGSIVIELEGMGAGELTLIDKEGTYLSKKASSRMKRLVKKAGKTVGLDVPTGTMEWMDSAAAYALKHGQQSMHLAGMDGKKPAFFGEAEDVVENIDNDMLALNADFVMELLRDI